MKLVQVFVVLMILLVGGFFVAKSIFAPKTCVPFAQKDVPNERDGNWKLIFEEVIVVDKNTKEVLQMRTTFEHKNAKGLKMSRYEIFGEVAFKAWACRPNGEKGDRPDHMISVLKDGKGHSAYAQTPALFSTKDSHGIIKEITVRLIDKDNKYIVEKTFSRPK